MPNNNKIEVRNGGSGELFYKTTVNAEYKIEKRADGKEEVVFTGYISGRGVPFNETANVNGYFNERIEPGAFSTKVLKDVALYTNHKVLEIPLARSKNGKGSLKLEIKPDGVYYSTQLDIENDMEARRLCSAIYRGDISGTSWIMHVSKERWEDLDKELPTRIIEEVNYFQEISLVNYPVYDKATNVDLRSANALDNARAVLDNAKKQLLEERQRDEELKKADQLAKLKNKIKNKYGKR